MNLRGFKIEMGLEMDWRIHKKKAYYDTGQLEYAYDFIYDKDDKQIQHGINKGWRRNGEMQWACKFINDMVEGEAVVIDY